MRKHLCLASVCTAVALAIALISQDAAPALAHPQGHHVPYTVSAEDEYGNPLRTFHKDGQTFLLGSYGRRYNLRLRNQTGARVEAVVSVDGRDVVSGRIGDFVSERGYVIDPYGTLVIEGFRKSHHEVAAFRFSEPGESYSARMGTPENVGVIGVAFFPERVRPAYRRPQLPMRSAPRHESWNAPHSSYDDNPRRKSASGYGGAGVGSAQAAPAAPSAAESERSAPRDKGYEARADHYEGDSTNNLGTQYGEGRESHVQEVAFRRANATQPQQVIALRYDDEQGLLARGIQLYESPAPVVSYERPNPFPRNHFAPPPP